MLTFQISLPVLALQVTKCWGKLNGQEKCLGDTGYKLSENFVCQENVVHSIVLQVCVACRATPITWLFQNELIFLPTSA